jgi:hypothetical protein
VELPGVNIEHRVVNEEGMTLLRTHDLNNFTFKSICRDCNNTWMSRLESEAKPLLLPLIEGMLAGGALSIDERRLLARWAFKTAFMILAGQKTNSVP